jgi:hypothetical protein
MKSLTNYIYLNSNFVHEEKDSSLDPKFDIIPRIKWSIWDQNQKRIYDVNKCGQDYNKIEYIYIDKSKNIKIQFLLGVLNNSWCIWVGKVGGIYYSDEPYCDLKTSDFKIAIRRSLDKVATFVLNVKNNPDAYQNYYLYI